jgi:hypothetical protein
MTIDNHPGVAPSRDKKPDKLIEVGVKASRTSEVPCRTGPEPKRGVRMVKLFTPDGEPVSVPEGEVGDRVRFHGYRRTLTSPAVPEAPPLAAPIMGAPLLAPETTVAVDDAGNPVQAPAPTPKLDALRARLRELGEKPTREMGIRNLTERIAALESKNND